MSKTVLYMSMSLDGFMAGPNVRDDNGLGDGGPRLHEWVFPPEGEVNTRVVAEFMATGAVVAGRGTFEPAGGWDGDHHDGVPIWVLSRNPDPAWAERWPRVHSTDDVGEAFRAARDAAGDRDVLVHGATVAQLAIRAGLLDEMEIHLVPVLFGGGRRLFEHLGVGQRELERVRVLAGDGGVTHLRYRLASDPS
ncbi:dihydrofolate reductase [Curtobacterium sp. PhB130]|uniref:dihydrofolate reductase family protein n=1 Tax=Curtobacterium sp. PhB130 TaxID=2485178 RepID=UPI000F4B678D|nr:dihydrofolate reductase family protein [Curtobacterium sp. PhB130]ROS73926.1 dihydrofolate reductase [Curtobacterium sp. PhB130]